MQINETTLREHYATLSSEQLLELYGRGTLTVQAMQVLDAVMSHAFDWLLKLVLLIGRGPGFRGPTMVVSRRALLRVRRH